MNAEFRIKNEEGKTRIAENRILNPETTRPPTTVRIRCRFQLLYFCLLHSAICLVAWAQPYAIDWYTIDGGGGTSTGGVYSVSGTVGQPDASTTTMTGGQYSVVGGFWSLIAVQTPGAPLLSITPAGADMAQISWTPDTAGFVLQETLSFAPTNWVNSVSGSANPVDAPATGVTRFYRLFKP